MLPAAIFFPFIPHPPFFSPPFPPLLSPFPLLPFAPPFPHFSFPTLGPSQIPTRISELPNEKRSDSGRSAWCSVPPHPPFPSPNPPVQLQILLLSRLGNPISTSALFGTPKTQRKEKIIIIIKEVKIPPQKNKPKRATCRGGGPITHSDARENRGLLNTR